MDLVCYFGPEQDLDLDSFIRLRFNEYQVFPWPFKNSDSSNGQDLDLLQICFTDFQT